jgi:hypothetical protein
VTAAICDEALKGTLDYLDSIRHYKETGIGQFFKERLCPCFEQLFPEEFGNNENSLRPMKLQAVFHLDEWYSGLRRHPGGMISGFLF